MCHWAVRVYTTQGEGKQVLISFVWDSGVIPTTSKLIIILSFHVSSRGGDSTELS